MYYVFGRSTKPRRWMDDEPFIAGISFLKGVKIARNFPTPLIYKLKRISPTAEDHSPYLPSTLGTRIPLFRTDLLGALSECGVDNLETYDSLIEDPETGHSLSNYRAVNILGVVAAADLGRSSARVHGGVPLVDVDFDDLVVDKAKAQGLLLFRLAESITTVIVHRSVRDHLTRSGFVDLAFREPGEVAT